MVIPIMPTLITQVSSDPQFSQWVHSEKGQVDLYSGVRKVSRAKTTDRSIAYYFILFPYNKFHGTLYLTCPLNS